MGYRGGVVGCLGVWCGEMGVVRSGMGSGGELCEELNGEWDGKWWRVLCVVM